MLKLVNGVLGLFKVNGEDSLITKKMIKGNANTQYEEFKESINNGDLRFLSERLDKPCSAEISDGEKQLAEGLKKIIGEVVICEKLDLVSDMLNEYRKKYQLLQDDGSSDPSNKFIYGVCKARSGKLCRYNIEAKKLETLVEVNPFASMVEVAGRIFISGGMPYQAYYD